MNKVLIMSSLSSSAHQFINLYTTYTSVHINISLVVGGSSYLLSVHRFQVLDVEFELLCLLSFLPVHLEHGFMLATHLLHSMTYM